MSDEYIDFSAGIKKIKNINQKIIKNPKTEYVLLGSIMILSFFIRTRNLKFLDGKYLLGLDPYYYLRQSTEILTYGKLPFPDLMRNAPFGIEKGFDLFPYFLAYFSKLMGIFGLNIVESSIIYPSLIMMISLIPFYLLVKLVFDKQIALLASLILSIIPAYLFRTMSGFADHESISMLLIFSAFYFLIKSESLELNKKYIYAGLSGFFVFLMSVSWNAYPFLFIIIGTYYLLRTFFSKVDYKKYLVFLISLLIPFIVVKGFNLSDIGLIYLLGISLIIILNRGINFERSINFPNILVSLSLVGVLGLIFILISDTMSFSGIINRLLNAGGVTKVDFTTSEALSTKVLSSNGYYSQFKEFIFISYLGFILLLNKLFEKLSKKENYTLTGIFAISIGLVIFGNWNSNIVLMEDTYLYFLFANFIFFMGYYASVYRKKNHHLINNLRSPEILIFISYFLVSGLLARTAVRFLFLMTPIVAILSSYLLVIIYKKIKINRIYQIGLIIISLILLSGSLSQTYSTAQTMGSSLPGQWESAFDWISENTHEDSVIAHWWDYGYWTQYVGNRASVNDGGRAGGELNMYTLARYGMTGSNDNENLEYFKSRNVSYLMYSEEEIGKYAAFSYIGSNIYEDKKSSIGFFILSDIKEVRTGNKLIYQGKSRTDSNIIEGNKLINSGNAVINEITLNLLDNGDIGPDVKMNLISNNFKKEYDIGCIYYNNKKIRDIDTELDYCITIIPTFYGKNEQNLGGILLQSKKVHTGLFSRLYINGESVNGFEKVYSDNTPLGFYNGRIVGPVTIWSINYFGDEKKSDTFTNLSKYIEMYPDHGIYSI